MLRAASYGAATNDPSERSRDPPTVAVGRLLIIYLGWFEPTPIEKKMLVKMGSKLPPSFGVNIKKILELPEACFFVEREAMWPFEMIRISIWMSGCMPIENSKHRIK